MATEETASARSAADERTDIRRIARLAEPVEVAAWTSFFENAPVDVLRRAGGGMKRRGSALAITAGRYDVVALNRLFCVGVVDRATESDVDDLLDLHAATPPARYAVQFVPGAGPAGLESWLSRRGFQPLNRWVRLYAACADLPEPGNRSDPRIERAGPTLAESFGSLCAQAFGWPPIFGPWLAASIGTPGWTHYLVRSEDTVVATGALFVHGSVGWLGMAATRPEFRRRGAQTALLLERIREARAAGCEWLVVETAEDRPDKPVQSFRNLVRLGFRVGYYRPTWVRTRDGAGAPEAGASPDADRD